MRIISGRFRGRRLRGPRGRQIRPTGDRLKETLFNIVGESIRDGVLLDIFAGTGAIGLEGISRGAREVVFIERDREGIQVIRQNLELCGVSSGFKVMEQDVFTALRILARHEFHSDFIFLDPPYNWQPYRDLLDLVFDQRIAGHLSCVVVEHHRKAEIPESGKVYQRSRVVQQGDHCLSFYRVIES